MDSVMGLCKALGGGERTISIGGRRIIEDRLLSEGGYAFVSLARDLDTGEEFALKKMICQNREVFELACREAQLLGGLPAHPNIIGFYGTTIQTLEDGSKCVYLLMEYCSGGHLLELLHSHNGTLTESTIIRVFTDITMSIFHLHSQNPPLIHRDIKLENVLRCSSSGLFKLCDFGSASTNIYDLRSMSRQQIVELEENISKTTTLMYRPPEMVDLYKKLLISEKGDIWMLGCILYSLIFNHHPFQDPSVLAISNANFEINISIANQNPKIIDLIFWTLSIDPESRPSAEDLLDVLQRYNNLSFIPLPQTAALRRTAAMHRATQTNDIRSRQLNNISESGIKAKLNSPNILKKSSIEKSNSNHSKSDKSIVTSRSSTGASRTKTSTKKGLRRDDDPLMGTQLDPFTIIDNPQQLPQQSNPPLQDLFAEFPQEQKIPLTVEIQTNSSSPTTSTALTVPTTSLNGEYQYNFISPHRISSVPNSFNDDNLFFDFNTPIFPSSQTNKTITSQINSEASQYQDSPDEFLDPFANFYHASATAMVQSTTTQDPQDQYSTCISISAPQFQDDDEVLQLHPTGMGTTALTSQIDLIDFGNSPPRSNNNFKKHELNSPNTGTTTKATGISVFDWML